MGRLRQLLLAALLVGCAGIVVGSVVLAMRYEAFTGMLGRSDDRVPQGVRAALAPSQNSLDRPTVTLVSATGELWTGGVLLLRTQPSARAVSSLTIPPSTTISGVRIGDQPAREVLGRLAVRAAVPIQHVVMVRLASIGHLVDTIGGIDLQNPRLARTILPSGSAWTFPSGRIHLDGSQTVAYLTQGARGSRRRDQAQERVMAALMGHAIVAGSASKLEETATAIATFTTTDLTNADILGMVWTRIQARHLVECTVPPGDALEKSQALRGFMGSAPAAARTQECSVRTTAGQSVLLPKAAIELLAQYGTWVFVAAAAIAALGMAGLSTAFAAPRLGVERGPFAHVADRRRLPPGVAHVARENGGRVLRRLARGWAHDGAAWAIGCIRYCRASSTAPGRWFTAARRCTANRYYRTRRFLYWHPDVAWAAICVTFSLFVGVVIGSF